HTEYDEVGNVLQITTGMAANAGYAHPSTTRYRYDPLNRRTAIFEGWTGGWLADDYLRGTTMIYDAVGNLLSQTTGLSTLTPQNRLVTSYVYDALNRPILVLNNWAPGPVFLFGLIPLPLPSFDNLTWKQYDANGNLVYDLTGISTNRPWQVSATSYA